MEVRARDWIFHKAKSIVIDHILPGVYLFAMQAKKMRDNDVGLAVNLEDVGTYARLHRPS